MNIRISSLDPSAPKGSRDCRVCNRRRIKCDRSLPCCQKCIIRKLECTGYDRKLKWNQGVASRGKFAGQSAPVSPQTPKEIVKYEIASREQSGMTIDTHQDIERSLDPNISLFRPFSESHDSRDRRTECVTQRDGHYNIDLSLSWSQIPHIYQDPHMRKLIHHYDHHIVPTFVWIDTPENRWRNDMLPLAQESSSLRSAILALASSHLSSRLPSTDLSANQLSARSARYRDHSLQLLAQHLEGEAQKHSSGSSTSAILATMYILCSLEMVPCDSAIWQLHLRASYVMIRRWLSTASLLDTLDDTSRYLVTQFSIINVFASTTSFGRIEKLLNVNFAERDSTIFSDYLEVIHAITVQERDRTALRDCGLPLNGSDLAIFIASLENARTRTRTLSQHLYLSTEQLKSDFDRVIEIYHCSGLIYAYQALTESSDCAKYISQLLDNLLHDLSLVSTSGPFAQDLSWPLFIAGTACRHLKAEQDLLERLTNEEMQFTGFSNCQQALKFLRAFWSESIDGETWIQFARRYSRQGQEFLAL